MNRQINFSLSYELLTSISEQYILRCIQNTVNKSARDAEIEMVRAGASLNHWYLLALAGNAPEAVVDADLQRMNGLILTGPDK
jgi:hypothetical protein